MRVLAGGEDKHAVTFCIEGNGRNHGIGTGTGALLPAFHDDAFEAGGGEGSSKFRAMTGGADRAGDIPQVRQDSEE